MRTEKPYGTVLLKADQILTYLAEHPHATLQKIARGTKNTNSTTLKILDTLGFIGYIQKKTDKTYTLGATLIRYANQTAEQCELIESTLPYLEKLQETIDETIHLGILSNQEIVYVNKLEPKYQTIRMSSKIGIARPLYSSAMGKAVLAEFSEHQFQAYIDQHELRAFTAHTLTDLSALLAEIKQIKATTIAYDREEMEDEIVCIGTALLLDKQLVGAFSVSLPTYRLTAELEEKITLLIRQTRQTIEKKIANDKEKKLLFLKGIV